MTLGIIMLVNGLAILALLCGHIAYLDRQEQAEEIKDTTPKG